MASKQMVIVSVTSNWEIADRFAEHLQQAGVKPRVFKALAYHVEVPESQLKQTDRAAEQFDPGCALCELLEKGDGSAS